MDCFRENLQHHHEQTEGLVLFDVFISQIHDDQPAWANQILETLVIIDIFAGEQ